LRCREFQEAPAGCQWLLQVVEKTTVMLSEAKHLLFLAENE